VNKVRQKIFWLSLPTTALFISTIALFSYFSEPRHNGRPLSAWLQDYHRSYHHQAAAEEAVRAIGPNAAPTLVKMLLPFERTFSLARLLKRTSIPIELLEDNSDSMPTYHLAMHGFRILGPAASNAIPLLLPHLENPNTAHIVADAIQTIGEPALASVQPLLAHTNAVTKCHAVHIILGITWRDPATVSNLLSSTDHIIRGETYLWLNSHYISPTYLFTNLLHGLEDPHPYVAQRAVIALRSLPLPRATNALPYLYAKQSTTNALLAQEITTAIKNIEKRIRIEASSPKVPR
jgi:hypothetical protein